MQRNMFPGCNSGGMGSMGINPLMFCGGMPAHHPHAPPSHAPHPSHHHHPHHHHSHHHHHPHLHHHNTPPIHAPPTTLTHHPPQPHAPVIHASAPPTAPAAATAVTLKGKKRKSSDSPARIQRQEKKPCTTGVLEHMKDTNLVMASDDHIIIMKAKYPKALHHYLVVPRENLASLKNAEARHLALFRHMDERARNFVASQNLQVSFRYGYHAIPITDQLVYLHAISQDFDSPWLRTKKQWNSFNTEYFIESTAVLQCLASRGRMVTCAAADGKRLLEMPISCHKCAHPATSMMELKQHLLKHLFTGPLMPDVAKSVHPLWPTKDESQKKQQQKGTISSEVSTEAQATVTSSESCECPPAAPTVSSNPYSLGDHYKTNKLTLPTQELYSAFRLAPVTAAVAQIQNTPPLSTAQPSTLATAAAPFLPDPMSCFKGTAATVPAATSTDVGRPLQPSHTSAPTSQSLDVMTCLKGPQKLPFPATSASNLTSFNNQSSSSNPPVPTTTLADPMTCFKSANTGNLSRGNLFGFRNPGSVTMNSCSVQAVQSVRNPSAAASNFNSTLRSPTQNLGPKGIIPNNSTFLSPNLRGSSLGFKNIGRGSLNFSPSLKNTTSNLRQPSVGLIPSEPNLTPSLKNPSPGLRALTPAVRNSPIAGTKLASSALKSPLSIMRSPMCSLRNMNAGPSYPVSSIPPQLGQVQQQPPVQDQQPGEEQDNTFSFRNPVCIFKHPKATFRKHILGSRTAPAVKRPVTRPPPSNPLACAIRHANWRRTFMELRKPKSSQPQISEAGETCYTSSTSTSHTTSSSTPSYSAGGSVTSDENLCSNSAAFSAGDQRSSHDLSSDPNSGAAGPEQDSSTMVVADISNRESSQPTNDKPGNSSQASSLDGETKGKS